ncbi:MAG: uracil-DNA glycosylase [Planctomycetes bacterium]|nr:uracil-DNA glycosylase [Planctomycetota bacterium]
MPSPGGDLGRLAARIRGCRLCPGLKGGFPGRGPLPARVAFVGEAPGRLGCGRTGIPFSGDRSAENLDRLLARAGLAREEVFVTNAVHCVPLAADGRNRRPTGSEVARCREHLLAELALVGPEVVVTMGAVAFGAVAGTPAGPLGPEVGRPRRVGEFSLFPVYHPSPRVAASRRTLEEQGEDFARLGRWLRRTSGRGR